MLINHSHCYYYLIHIKLYKNNYYTQEVTVEEALVKGQRMLLLPRILIVIGSFIFLFPLSLSVVVYLDKPFTLSDISPWFYLALIFTFIIEVYLPFRFWSKRTTSWKLWAFDEVRNVNELMKTAINKSLMPREGTLLDRLQIKSNLEKEKWLSLQRRFKQPDEQDDPNIKSQTLIYYSKTKNFANIMLILPLFIIGSVLFYIAFINPGPDVYKIYILSSIILLISAYGITPGLNHIFNRKPQLILDNYGITTPEAGFHSWSAINNVEVYCKITGKNNRDYFLNYSHYHQQISVNFTYFDKNQLEVEKLIQVYQYRS